MPKDKAYWHEYWKTPKRRAYIKKYRSTPEYRAKQREYDRRYKAKKRRHAAIDAATDE